MRRTERSSPETLNAFDGVRLDFLGMEVTRCGEKVRLTNREFKTLNYMIKNSNKTISRDELLNEVSGYQSQAPTLCK
jgi:DNA-binding response OmpR family regulator